MSNEDIINDTLKHIRRVRELMEEIEVNLEQRAQNHDRSKLEEPERSRFLKATEELRGMVYGEPAYLAALEKNKDVFALHYRNNSHHPEHSGRGINGMTLLDLVEMVCDWKAGSERQFAGNFERSVKVGVSRFRIEPQLADVLENTRKEMGW